VLVLAGIWGNERPGEALVGDMLVLVGDDKGFFNLEGRTGLGLPGIFVGLVGEGE